MLAQFLVLDDGVLVDLWDALEVYSPAWLIAVSEQFVLLAVEVEVGFVVAGSDVVSGLDELEGG